MSSLTVVRLLGFKAPELVGTEAAIDSGYGFIRGQLSGG